MKRLAALGAFKLSLFLKGRVNEDFFKEYSRLISPDVSQEEIDSLDVDPEELFDDDPELAERWDRLLELVEDDDIAVTAIQLYLLALMEERTLDLLREGMGQRNGLTIETAARLTYPEEESLELVPEMQEAFQLVELLLRADPEANPIKAPFCLDWRLAGWLDGDDTPDSAIHAVLADPEDPLPEPLLTREQINEVSTALDRSEGFSLIHLWGERGSGRRFFARHVAKALDRELLIVPFSALCRNDHFDPEAWRLVLRELLLSDRLLCLTDLELPGRQDLEVVAQLLQRLEADLAPLDRPVFLTTGSQVKITPFVRCPVCQVPIPEPGIPQSEALWTVLAKQELGSGDFPAAALAARMTLVPGQMVQILRLLKFRQPEGPWQLNDIFRLCYQVLDDGRYENIRFVDTTYTWDDLKLAPPLMKELDAVCAQVEHQGLVLDQWGLRRRYPYGCCVSVLMSGPPGTGKTMTAQVLAARLGLQLYKVDLSQIVDKYIGETEKRLKQVFDQAEKSCMVLFFDEADALLGKRSEVKDAKDKYANTEVAYLLQRMEEYSGIVLMATNQAGNMDAAFARRFRYHLTFTLPDEAMRRTLWESALAGIPAGNIQLDYLARQFQLSGAQIKNIALNAAYQAAQDGGRLTMVHLVRATAKEFRKEGKVVLSSEFGEFGPMLEEN